ncbi:MAG: TspO/MBR family protein [Armatimonas sp.]
MTAKHHQHVSVKPSMALVGWLLLCFSAALGGVLFSTRDWYATLVKPAWSPPAWVFGPVWTTLYALMAVAAWLVWQRGGWRAQGTALGLFVAQWVLNALWTPLFFGLHNAGLAFAEITGLWVTLAATLLTFWRVRKLAGILLLPYLLWVSFAAMLNFSIWQLNL